MFKRYIFSLVMVIALVGAMLPQPVYAATQTRPVVGEGSQTEFGDAGTPGVNYGYIGGDADYTNLNSDDGDTSYAAWLTSTSIFHYCWEFQDFTETVQSISSVTLYYKMKDALGVGYGFWWVTPYCRISGTNYYGDYVIVETDVYTLRSYTWSNNPAGGAWDNTSLNSAEFGLKLQGITPYTSDGHLTYTYLNINYTPITVPVVSTSAASGLTTNTTHCWANLNGSVTDDGGANVTERGFAWSTTCNATNPGNQAPPATYTSNWTEGSEDWGTGSFSHNVTLLCCTAYCYRAYALNSEGWAWGDEVSFATLCDPEITTKAATNISANTTRLNAEVVNDGGQPSYVRFCYGTVSGNCTVDVACGWGVSCNCTTYNATSGWLVDTYTTGEKPYFDATGLIAGTAYYFCAQIKNDMSCRCGGELSFTTASGIEEPTELTGIATSSTVSLAWVKGTGCTNTPIRYKLGSYPTSTSGLDTSTLVYFDTMTSKLHTGLTPGTTYYYTAWGESGGVYSSGNATLMITTLAITAAADDLPVGATPSQWFTAPNYSNMENMPFYEIVNFAADQFSVPYSTMWYMLALVTCTSIGVIFYSGLGNHNLLLSIIVVGVSIMISSFLQLVPMWHIAPFAIIAAVGIFVGERR